MHLSASGAVPALHAARAAGVDVSVETCPHYLHFEAGSIPDGATELKCCPPIRDATNRDALWAALGSGDIDMVVSDHSPCTAELKRQDTGDFADAWGGIASLQLGLPVVWTSARERGVPLTDVVRWMSTAPARRVGLAGKGEIAVGNDADLCVFAPDETWTVDAARLHHKNPVSAYAGLRLTGVVRETWLRGSTDRRDGKNPRRTTAEERRATMTYHVPTGGLPAQTALTTGDSGRAVFTEAYAVLPRGTMRDIVTSRLPHWDDTRLWVIARPLSGFAETFSWYVVEVAAGGGSDRPDDDPDAESVLLRGRRQRGAGDRRGAAPDGCRRLRLPPAGRRLDAAQRAATRPRPSTGSARPTSGSTASRCPSRSSPPRSTWRSSRCPRPTAPGAPSASSTRSTCATTCTSTSSASSPAARSPSPRRT